ncbi:MAG: hypothetical protein IT310_07170 [Anaerolineales bacterium]|nr:hypothetical protein [Anaerolineales bacterium]
MTEEKQKRQTGFLGTYFERDSILRFSKIANVFAWTALLYHGAQAALALGVFGLQLARGLLYLPGFTDVAQQILWQIQPLVPGMSYFVGIQAVGKALLILMDIEDNTRRAARQN